MKSYEITPEFIAHMEANGIKAVGANYTLGGHSVECYLDKSSRVEMMCYRDCNADIVRYAIVPEGKWLALSEASESDNGMNGYVSTESALGWLDRNEKRQGRNGWEYHWDWVDENGNDFFNDDDDEDE